MQQFKVVIISLSVDKTIFKENNVILLPDKTVRHTEVNKPLEPLIYHHCPHNENLCIVKCLLSYIGTWNTLVTQEVKDLISGYGKPHKPVSSETISRLIKDEFSKAGVDTLVFKAHSCRSVSSSKWRDACVSVSEISKKQVEKVYIPSKYFTPGI